MFSEIRDEIRAIDTGPKAIRNFGITFFVVLGVVGGLMIYKDKSVGYAGIGFGVLFLILGLWAPITLKALYKVWMALAAVLGFFMSRVILSLLFYLVVTPTGLAMRLFGKDVLDQRWDKKAATYWKKRDSKHSDKKRYERLY